MFNRSHCPEHKKRKIMEDPGRQRKKHGPCFCRRRECGGAAVEYTLVSTFAVFLAIVLLKFSAGIFRQKIESIAEKLGTDVSALDFSLFDTGEDQ